MRIRHSQGQSEFVTFVTKTLLNEAGFAPTEWAAITSACRNIISLATTWTYFSTGRAVSVSQLATAIGFGMNSAGSRGPAHAPQIDCTGVDCAGWSIDPRFGQSFDSSRSSSGMVRSPAALLDHFR
jgi:hypothetical protein